jgi:DNA-binding transcriptional ArsR family regulator
LVFLHVVRHPRDTVIHIAHELGLAERTVAGILSDLRVTGYLTAQRVGQRNLYSVNPQLHMRHPSQSHYTVQDFFASLEGIEQEEPYQS